MHLASREGDSVIGTIRARLVVSLAVLAALSPCRATAEPYVVGYAGAAITQDKNLRTEVEVNGAPFVNGLAHDLNFDTAPVFGAKAGYFLDRRLLGGHVGAELDVFHFRPDVAEQQVRFTGLLAGVQGSVHTTIPATDIEVTALTVNLLYRLALASDATYPRGRLQPYLGVGGGAFIARLETTTTPFDVNRDISDTDVQPGLQALAGARWFVTRSLALFAEYKFLHTETFSFKFRETGTIGGVPVTETARDRADLTSHLFYGGLGFHW
jgi:opacity protein-like surface antigen